MDNKGGRQELGWMDVQPADGKKVRLYVNQNLRSTIDDILSEIDKYDEGLEHFVGKDIAIRFAGLVKTGGGFETRTFEMKV